MNLYESCEPNMLNKLCLSFLLNTILERCLKEVINPYLVFNKTVAYLFNDSTKLHEIWTEDRTYRVQKIDMTYKVPRPPVAMATSENCGSLSILWQTYLSKYIQ